MRMPAAAAASAIAAAVAGSTGTRGSRSSFSIRPIAASMHFTGPGLDSRNNALKSGRRRWWTAWACAMRPARAWSHSARISAGATFPATDTTPLAPTAIMGNVSESSPQSRVKRVRARTALAWSRLPDASLMATMLGRS